MAKFSVNIEYNGEKLEVSGEVYAACRGAREHGTGLQLEPDEDASLEFEEMIFEGVNVIGLMETAMDKIEELTWEALNEQELDFDSDPSDW